MGSIMDTIGIAMGVGQADQPTPRDLNAEIEAIIKQGPNLLKSQQELSPGYNRLRAQSITDLLPATTAANTAFRAANQGDLASLGPGAVTNMRALDPRSAGLYDSLQTDAEAGLAAGDRLTSDQAFNATNPIRSRYAASGFAPGAMEELEEGINLFGAGNALGQQRRANAAGTARLGQELYTNPSLSWLSPGSTVSATRNPSALDELGGYGSNLYGQNYQGMYGTNINNANNALNAWLTTGKQMSSDIGAIAAGAGFCWTARLIYGPWDPQWLEFRDWIISRAPAKLRNWYLVNGKRWAARIARNPTAIAAVRRWMDRRIAT